MSDVIESAKGLFFSGLDVFSAWAWVLWIIVGFAIFFGIVYLLSSLARMKKQWTHTIIIRRKNANGTISPQITKIRAMRYINPETKKLTSNFRLEKAVLGSNLLIDPLKYSNDNEISLILDENNRLWFNEGEVFCPSKNSIYVSAKHAEIDLAHEKLRETVKALNTLSQRRDWKEIAKTVLKFLLIIGAVIICVIAIQEYGKGKQYDAQKAQSEAEAMKSLNEAMTTMQATVNTQQLEITYLLQKAYGTQDLQQWLNKYNETYGGNNGN